MADPSDTRLYNFLHAVQPRYNHPLFSETKDEDAYEPRVLVFIEYLNGFHLVRCLDLIYQGSPLLRDRPQDQRDHDTLMYHSQRSSMFGHKLITASDLRDSSRTFHLSLRWRCGYDQWPVQREHLRSLTAALNIYLVPHVQPVGKAS